MRINHKARSGFSLIEMCVVMIALGAAMTVSVLLMVAIVKTQRLADTMQKQITWQASLGERFHEDVHHATGTLKNWNQYDAGPQCLILEQPGGKCVVYDFRDDRLLRDAGESQQQLPLPRKAITVEFTVSDSLITLRLADKQPKDTRPPYEIVAKLGGARR